MLLLVMLTAVYVAAEFATVKSRRTRINQLAAEGNALAKRLLPVFSSTQSIDNYIATTQIGITIISLALGAYGQGQLAALLKPLLLTWHISDTLADSIATTSILVALTAVQVVLGELLPKSLAVQYPEIVAMYTAIPMQWSAWLFRPVTMLFNGSSILLMRLFGLQNTDGHGSEAHSPDEIELLVSDSTKGGLLQAAEQQMLRNAFRLRGLTARQAMTPRTKIAAAPVEYTVEQVLKFATEHAYSRIPLYEGSLDTIKQYVHIKDLFRLQLEQKADWRSIARDMLYVPETMPIVDAWQALTGRHAYMAIVFDEYGGTAGLLTFEDLIEEVTGELQDEFDDEDALVSTGKDGRIYLQAELLVADINEYLGLNLPSDEVDTLGGLVFASLGRLPKVDDTVTLGDPPVTLCVVSMQGNTILEVALQKVDDNPELNSVTAENGQIGDWEVATRAE